MFRIFLERGVWRHGTTVNTEVTMTKTLLDGFTAAILATEGFEYVELMEPRRALDAAGATTRVVSPNASSIQGYNHHDKSDTVPVDETLDRARPEDFDALLLPGGVMNPDQLRMDERAVRFVKAFMDAGKPVAVICDGPWTLVEADVVRGRRLTSWPSLKTDIRNAGGEWVDQANVTDGNLTSSRKPDDLPQFNEAMLALFSRSRATQTA
jgi:protease I